MNYGYIKANTDRRAENQRININHFCRCENICIDEWVEEKSSTRTLEKRVLGKILDKVGNGDRIICSDISRLGDDVMMIIEILHISMTKGCRLWTVKDNFRFGDDSTNNALAFAFGKILEIERSLVELQKNKYVADGSKQGFNERSWENSAASKKRAARENPHNKVVWGVFYNFIQQNKAKGKKPHPTVQQFAEAVETFKKMGIKTSTGMEYNFDRVRNAFYNMKKYMSY